MGVDSAARQSSIADCLHGTVVVAGGCVGCSASADRNTGRQHNRAAVVADGVRKTVRGGGVGYELISVYPIVGEKAPPTCPIAASCN